MFGTAGMMNGLLPVLSGFSAARAGLVPLIFLAIGLDIAIVGSWYIVGTLLHNNSVKKSAISELYQAFGTAIIAFLVIFTILTFSAVFYSSLNATSLMSQSTISGMCSNLAQHSPLMLLGSGVGSVLESSTNNGICDFVSSPSTVSQQAEYPLAASAVVIANITNQTGQNLNSLFIFDAYMGFLENLAPTMSYCVGPFTDCAIPLLPLPAPKVRTSFSFKPYVGYNLIYQSANQMIVMFGSAFEAFVAQLVIAQVFIFAWPWLLFGGLLLRATFFTRKIGGLFIAIALGALLIYPAVFAMEYLTLGSGSAASYNSIYGYNSITNLPSHSGTYTLNFFVQPKMSDVLSDNGNGCFISKSAPITDMESADVEYLLIPFSSIASGIVGAFGTFISSVPYFYLPYPAGSCKPQEAVALIFKIAEAYGIAGVTAYFLPIINIIITLASIIGLSGLLGGDTSLGGISRLI